MEGVNHASLPPRHPLQQQHRQQSGGHDQQGRPGGFAELLDAGQFIGLGAQRVEVERPQDEGEGQFLDHIDGHQCGGGEQGGAQQGQVHPEEGPEGAGAQGVGRLVQFGALQAQAAL